LGASLRFFSVDLIMPIARNWTCRLFSRRSGVGFSGFDLLFGNSGTSHQTRIVSRSGAQGQAMKSGSPTRRVISLAKFGLHSSALNPAFYEALGLSRGLVCSCICKERMQSHSEIRAKNANPIKSLLVTLLSLIAD